MSTEKIQSLHSWFVQLSSHNFYRQLTFLLGLAGSVALGMWLVLWIQQPSMTPLYGEMPASEVESVLSHLDRQGINYRVDGRSGLVEVPPDQVHSLRMQLASAGLPDSSGRGFEMLYQPAELGLSSFIERARYDRAIEEELARTISSMGSVQTARVHLAIPEVSGYLRDRAVPEASVLISLGSGMDLSDQQVLGIQYLVASSVADLSTDKVSVIDGQGRLLSRAAEDAAYGAGQDRFQMTQQVETQYVDRILNLVTPLVGSEGVRAQVAVDLNFTSVETTAERYEPEASVRSEQISQERSNSTTAAGGVPGTLSNQPPEDATVVQFAAQQEAATTTDPVSTVSNEIRNYELDRTISYAREAPGTINRLSAAVVLDYVELPNAEGVLERVPMPEEELEHIRGLVREALGFSEARGDSLNVISASFISPIAIEPLPEPAIWEQPWVWRALRTLLASALLFAIFLAVVRPMLRAGHASNLPATAAAGAVALAAPAVAAGQIAAPTDASVLAGEDQVTLGASVLQQPAIPYEQQLLIARSMAEEQPQRVAQVVRNWVVTDE